MLHELTVRNLGVIKELNVVLGTGMTVLTGETGAGKTLVVEAIELLMGGRPDSVLVRPGADEALVEGRFVHEGTEVILSRVVPVNGRSRAYVDGRMVPVSMLADLGTTLVDLHGQHAHQSLLSPGVQRQALDRFAEAESDVAALAAARARLGEIDVALAGLGGDARVRARELDLVQFQLGELEDAAIADIEEDDALEAEEDLLADATGHREAAASAYEALQGEGGVVDGLGTAIAWLSARGPFIEFADRLRAVHAELVDVIGDVRAAAERLADDPERLARVRARRQLLRELCRKYGATLAEVLAFTEDARRRLDELRSYEGRAAELEHARASALVEISDAARRLAERRRGAAHALAGAVESHLRTLALPDARFGVEVGERDPGDDVVFTLGANPGEAVLPLTKVASGGELARTMLAARLVLSLGPPTLVFDEVDAGVGGEAAVAVGRALAALGGEDRQVLVVTHLAQVAAFADAHVVVSKVVERSRTVARATLARGEARIVELSRMMTGQPESQSARRHASELLDLVAAERGREPGTGPVTTGRRASPVDSRLD